MKSQDLNKTQWTSNLVYEFTSFLPKIYDNVENPYNSTTTACIAWGYKSK